MNCTLCLRGANENVPLPNVYTEELEIIGEKITHAFMVAFQYKYAKGLFFWMCSPGNQIKKSF